MVVRLPESLTVGEGQNDEEMRGDEESEKDMSDMLLIQAKIHIIIN